MPAFNNMYKIFPPQHLPTTPYGKQSGNPNTSLHLPPLLSSFVEESERGGFYVPPHPKPE
jgi:hypothetical protein